MPENVLAGTQPEPAANQAHGQPNNAPLGGDAYTTMGGPSATGNDVSADVVWSPLLLDLPKRCLDHSSIVGLVHWLFVAARVCLKPPAPQQNRSV